jgi:hypothetical protein
MLRLIDSGRSPLPAVGTLILVLLGGCASSKPPPPSDKAAVEKELKQLNDNRQKEWGNK